jgi:[ribosomal protein S18]-alanine N-acetyltransferase
MSSAAPMCSVSLRAMHAGDLERVVAIEEQSSSQPWTIGIFRDELADLVTRRYVVAECHQESDHASHNETDHASHSEARNASFNEAHSEVAGFCGTLFLPDEAHITNIAVSPACRRQRIAEQLMLEAMRSAIARSVTNMTLEVRVSNDAAIALYRRFGFGPGGIRKAYYANNREDALVMWAHDINTSAYGLRLAEIAERSHRLRNDQLKVDRS